MTVPVDSRPLWQRAIERRMRQKRIQSLENAIVSRSIVRVNAARPPGLRCVSCQKGGAVFGDPKVRPQCGACWRRELRALRRELADA